MTRAEFDAAVEKMRAVEGGAVSVADYFPRAREPYRYGKLDIRCHFDMAPDRARELAELAIEIGGYLTMVVHAGVCSLGLAVERELEEEELEDAPCACREVGP